MPINLFSVMFLFALVFLLISRFTVERIEDNHYAQRSSFFNHYKVSRGDIVFVGDSITDGGAWEEIFPGVPLKNRGINADNTFGVLKRMDDIVCCEPLAIFLLIGTNDLPWFTYKNNTQILKEYEQILVRCHELSPHTRVFVQSILPRTKSYSRRIIKLNAQLELLAARHDYVYVDLYSAFADADGAMQSHLTNDHLHLMAEGYIRWAEILQPHIAKLLADQSQDK